jgi:hypothetical protein
LDHRLPLDVELVRPDQVEAAWVELGGYIELAQRVPGCGLTAGDLMRSCTSDPAYTLVRFPGGAAVLDASTDDLHIVSIGAVGAPRGWMDHFQLWLECAAEALGRARITCKGRRGWRRRLRRYGYHDIGDGYLGMTP